MTLLAVRVKMFQMEKGIGWKERGAGMLKVNVPKNSIELDDYGNPDMASFDASVLGGDGEGDGEGEGGSQNRSTVRLVMRQDHTLRVILNTAIVPAMKFQLTQKLKAAFVLFTAFEGNQAKQVQMKASQVLSCRAMPLANQHGVDERSERHTLHAAYRAYTEAALGCLRHGRAALFQSAAVQLPSRFGPRQVPGTSNDF